MVIDKPHPGPLARGDDLAGYVAHLGGVPTPDLGGPDGTGWNGLVVRTACTTRLDLAIETQGDNSAAQ
jgi:hypothetical protein